MNSKSVFLSIISIIALSVLIVFKHQAEYLRVKYVTVFIHGTILPGLGLLNPYKMYTHTLETGDWYNQSLSQARENSLLYQDGIILQPGLRKVEPTLMSLYRRQELPSGSAKLAAYQAIGAYDQVASTVSPNTVENEYYTYGFLGLLSDNHRKEAADTLYTHLQTLQEQHRLAGYKTIITLIGYSHGGNVALYLGRSHQQKLKKYDFTIDTVVLLGTPLYPETVQHTYSGLFKSIINIYSEGDTVQPYETISTPQKQSFNTLKQLKAYSDTGTQTSDVLLKAYTNSHAFGHYEFWYFNSYSTSLWQDTQTQAVYNTLSPLPLVVLVPVIIAALKNSNLPEIEAVICTDKHNLYLTFDDRVAQKQVYRSSNIYPAIYRAQEYALRTWQPQAHTNDVLKTGLGFWSALQALCIRSNTQIAIK